MKQIYEFIDKILERIPEKVRRIINFSAISIWILAAVMSIIITYQKGKKESPIVGEDYFLKDLQEKIQKNQNLKKNPTILLPDLNDLVKEEIPLKIESSQEILKKQEIDIDTRKKIEILSEKDELKFFENSNKNFLEIDQNNKEKKVDENLEKKNNKIKKIEPLSIE